MYCPLCLSHLCILKFYFCEKNAYLNFMASIIHVSIYSNNFYYISLKVCVDYEGHSISSKGFLPAFQFSSVAQLCPTLCDPMDCSMPGFPIPHQFPEFAQVLVHCIGDTIQPLHPLSPSYPLPSVFPSIRVFSSELAICISIGASASALVLMSIRIDFL